MDQTKLSRLLICFLFFIFLLNYFALKLHWYFSVWYFDIPMHFLGGFWLGLAYVYLFPPKEKTINSVLKILLFVLTMGIGWEVFEISVNEVIVRNAFNYFDTISDIFFDLAGGSLAALCFFKLIMPIDKNGVQ